MAYLDLLFGGGWRLSKRNYTADRSGKDNDDEVKYCHKPENFHVGKIDQVIHVNGVPVCGKDVDFEEKE